MTNRKMLMAVLASCALLTASQAVTAAEADVMPDEYEGYAGYVDIPHETYSINEGMPRLKAQNTNMSYYDAREHGQVTSVKNQNPWGTCWSFSAIAALESGMLSRGIYDDIDLSEYHLINYNFRGVQDPLGGTAEDSIQYTGTLTEFLNAGGNVQVAYHALTNWVGAADESLTGYPGAGAVTELPSTVENAYLSDLVHVQQVYMISADDVSAIKEAITQYGAVTAAMSYQSTYLNSTTAGYYNPYDKYSNHAITVVGWDDAYSRDNFKIAPASDGAWLVKNSWDTYFGDGGYIWLSYEDASLQDTFCVLVGEEADNYDNNYQYDGSYLNRYLQVSDSIGIANVFKIQSGEAKEALRAVAFEVGNTNINYSIQIYTDLKDKTNPTSGKAMLAEPVTGKTSFQGYYTVELPKEILLEPDQEFAVVVTLQKSGSIRVVLEASNVWNNTNYVAGAKENQSFMKLGRSWEDMGTEYNGNVRIKAFTCNTGILPDVAVEGVEAPEEVALTVGESCLLTATVYPTDAANQAVSWSSANNEVAEVDGAGNVTAKKRGTAVITCTTEEGGFIAQTLVTVRNAIEMEADDRELTVGSSLCMMLSLNGEAPSAEYNQAYDWSVDDEDVVTIDAEGKITGRGMGSATIRCAHKEDPEETAAFTVDIKLPFSDIRVTDWQYAYVRYVYDNNIMLGKSSERFAMNQKLSRSEFVTVLYNYSGTPDIPYTQEFSDVKPADWFALPVTWAKESGITAGYGNGKFGVSNPITREQLVKMLYEFAKNLDGLDVSTRSSLAEFADESTVSTWAVPAMEWAVANQIITGKPRSENEIFLDPAGNATRGECATIMKKYGDLLK